MRKDNEIYFITHADVQIDPKVPVPQWALSDKGRARHETFNRIMLESDITEIYCSDERKAIDGAVIMSECLGIAYMIVAELHENDRSATGYLPAAEFEKTADEFFGNPEQSVRGWEKAVVAQQRIVLAIEGILQNSATAGNIAIVSHGGVGALMLCHLTSTPISRTMDQPDTGGGNYFAFKGETRTLVHGWRNMGGSAINH